MNTKWKTLCWLPWMLLLLVGCVSRPSSAPAPVIHSDERDGSYRVKPGDTLYSIAWGLELDYLTLASWNNLTSPYTLEIGQRLRVRSTASARPEGRPQQREESGYISRQVAPEFLPWRGDSSQLPEPRSQLRWLWPTSGPAVPDRSGIGIRGTFGQPVMAAEMGQVVYSGSGLKGYGNLVIIKHRHHYLSAYGFNRRLLVAEGDRVSRGQQIAEMGEGREGAALFFEIRQRTRPLDPLSLLPKHLSR